MNCRIPNPDIPRAGRSGAAHGGGVGKADRGEGGAGRVRAERDGGGSMRPSCSPEHQRRHSRTYPRRHKQTKSYLFPGQALHEKDLQGQKNVGPLVSPRTKSGRRPADKPLVKRGFRCPIGLYKISFVRASEETVWTVAFDALEGTRDGCLLGELTGRTDPSASRPARPRPAPPPRRAPPRPDPPVVCPGSGSDKL